MLFGEYLPESLIDGLRGVARDDVRLGSHSCTKKRGDDCVS
jgi:hypothetical protein